MVDCIYNSPTRNVTVSENPAWKLYITRLICGASAEQIETTATEAQRHRAIFQKSSLCLSVSVTFFKELMRRGSVGVYGSFAAGKDIPESDIDLWIYSKNHIDAIALKNITRKFYLSENCLWIPVPALGLREKA